MACLSTGSIFNKSCVSPTILLKKKGLAKISDIVLPSLYICFIKYASNGKAATPRAFPATFAAFFAMPANLATLPFPNCILL